MVFYSSAMMYNYFVIKTNWSILAYNWSELANKDL